MRSYKTVKYLMLKKNTPRRVLEYYCPKPGRGLHGKDLRRKSLDEEPPSANFGNKSLQNERSTIVPIPY
jgi:hypothetical protein